MHLRRLLVFLACAALAALPACRHAPSRPPNIILIVVDTLRADRVGAYGNPRGLTPFLDELAARGAVFTNAYATSSWTIPSVASLFTSRMPSQHQVTTFASKVADEEITVGELLETAGYQTGGFSANFRLTRDLGYAQGFQKWAVFSGNATQTSVKARGDRLRNATLAWLDSVDKVPPPIPPRFLYLQYMEPHSPYEPNQPFRERFERLGEGVDVAQANARMHTVNFKLFTPAEVDVLESLYDGEVASADAEIRTLFAALEVRGFLKDAVVIITADHGEEFKEHGRMAHGHALYNESIRVPLIVVAPSITAGKRIDDNVSLLDVAPTILDLAGLSVEPTFEGHSLVPRVQRRSLRDWLFSLKELPPDVISELPKTGSRLDVRGHSRAFVQGQTKLLVELRGAEKKEVPILYDLRSDPGETAPAKRSRRADAMQAVLQERTEALAKRAAVSHQTGVVDDSTKEKLRALGYQF